jgi:hypothetical protein
MKITLTIVLLAVWSNWLFAPSKQTGNATSNGTCSPSVTSNNNTFTFAYCGDDPKERAKILKVLNELAHGEDVTNAKLNQVIEILDRREFEVTVSPDSNNPKNPFLSQFHVTLKSGSDILNPRIDCYVVDMTFATGNSQIRNNITEFNWPFVQVLKAGVTTTRPCLSLMNGSLSDNPHITLEELMRTGGTLPDCIDVVVSVIKDDKQLFENRYVARKPNYGWEGQSVVPMDKSYCSVHVPALGGK